MTPNDLITLSLKTAGVIGVGQTPAAEDMNDCLTLLNMMLAQWKVDRLLVYHLQDVSKVATGAQSYTIGPAGDFNVNAHVTDIDSAYVRMLNQSAPNQPDYPLGVIKSREDYSGITLKQLSSFPNAVFLDSDWPLGKVYVWPIPTSQYEIHLLVKTPLSSLSSLNTAIQLPEEYLEPLMYNLAVRIRPAFQLPPDMTVTALAKASLNTIRRVNTQLPIVTMPDDLGGRGAWNPYTGSYNR